jgi:hypothetical protein
MNRVTLDVFLAECDPIYDQPYEYACKYLETGQQDYEAYVTDEGLPVFAVGIYKLWPGVGTVWVLLDKRAPRYLKSILKLVRAGIPKAWAAGYKRIQGEFWEFVPTLGLAEKCGFQVEGYLRNYGMGGEGNYFICSKVKS